MTSLDDLRLKCLSIDGRGYPNYKQIAGSYAAKGFTLFVDHVQGDPFASPSRLRVIVDALSANLPDWSYATPTQRIASADFMNRLLSAYFFKQSQHRGSGKSGMLDILRPGQEVLARTSVQVYADGRVEARFRAGLPAQGRRILGRQAAALVSEDIPQAVQQTLSSASFTPGALEEHVRCVEDAQMLRQQLNARGLIAFIADGAILPRASGVDERPLNAKNAKPFKGPEYLRVELDSQHSGPIKGLGIPAGVTLIVGGGYHGKSTLLRAIERGVYDHIPGDGREMVVSIEDAVKVRAEDGRAICGVDISNFINNLPNAQKTDAFVSENASGSTSQAAAIVEALEVGAKCILLDEDTSATNFMIRDARMQALVKSQDEPITPFIDRTRQLFDAHGVSTILVVGGAGDYFDVADEVIAMREYEPHVVSTQVKSIAEAMPSKRQVESPEWQALGARMPDAQSIDARKGRKDVSIKAYAKERVLFGRQEVDLSALEQLVEIGQARAIAQALLWGKGQAFAGQTSLALALRQIHERLSTEGLDVMERRPG
ncbi:MAG: ABC-ATPase domain-containing protein, partial [Myxococcota bacterium]|nr:ABC-ATPase domain-containing protein [Myxococcota bacterium]